MRIIWEHGWIAALIVLFVLLLIRRHKEGGSAAVWAQVASTAYMLMLAAEKKWGRAVPGKHKFDWVVERLWPMLPVSLKHFVTLEKLKEKVQFWYDTMKHLIFERSREPSVEE